MTTDATEPSPKTFDLAAALAGRTFPEIVVPVFFDEELQFELNRIDKEISTAPAEEADALVAQRDELLEKFKQAIIKVRVKGTPRHVRKATLDKVLEEHPNEYTPWGALKPNPEGDEAYTNATWALHVVEITGPDGSTLVPSESDITAFRSQAPDSAIIAVERAIQELTEGSKSGYETAIQDLDFLSRP